MVSTGSRLSGDGADLRRRLFVRGKRAMRLRQVIAVGEKIEGGDPLFDMCPVWMASPETVAQIFPRRPLFDIVIFDRLRQFEILAHFSDAQIERLSGFATAAEATNDDYLTPDERITKAVLIEEAGGRADELRSRSAEFDVSPSWGLHIVLPQFTGQLPITEPEHAEALVEKWSKLGTTFDQLVHRLRQGLAKERTPPRSSVEKVIAQIDQYLALPIMEDPFVNVPAPSSLNPREMEEWRNQLVTQTVDVIRPGYERYRHELSHAVMPKARPEARQGKKEVAPTSLASTR